MTKSIKTCLLTVAALLGSISAYAHDFEVDGIYYNTTSDATVEVTFRGSSYNIYDNEYSGGIIIPSTVTYYGKEYGVTSIGKVAFSDCSGLTSVTIGNSVTSIEYGAFESCKGLQDVYCLAENVPSTDTDAFIYSYREYVTLHVPAGSIESYKTTTPWSGFGTIKAFSPFSGEVEINGINYKLNGETKQATVIAKSSGLYSGEVVIPESVEHQGTTYSVTSIGQEAFRSCWGMTSVTIPNSVMSIGDNAFWNCYGLTSVTIGNSVTSIGEAAFYKCYGLTSVHISDIAAWCNIGFDTGDSNPLYYAHHLYLNGEEVKDLVIPNSVTSIGDYAFFWCSGLTSVTIPNSVTSIGRSAFSNCSGLTSVTIPNSVENIVWCAFSGCSGLTSVTIPNSVTGIGEFAFSGCSGLQDVYCYAEKVPSVEGYAFGYGFNYSDATLHVPASSLESYKTNEPWSEFGNIIAITE